MGRLLSILTQQQSVMKTCCDMFQTCLPFFPLKVSSANKKVKADDVFSACKNCLQSVTS